MVSHSSLDHGDISDFHSALSQIPIECGKPSGRLCRTADLKDAKALLDELSS
jgi:hypothetical protein